MASTKKKSLQTLESILNHSATLFWKRGIDHVTFSDVAKKVGVSQPALYAYAVNKMDLLHQVCLWSIQKGRNYIDSQLDPKSRALENLEKYVRANLHFFYEEKVHAHSLLALYYFGVSNLPLLKLYQTTQLSSLTRLNILLVQAQNEGMLVPGCEDQLSASLHSMLVGYCYRSIYATSRAEYKKIQTCCWQDFEKMLSFYRPKSRRS